MACGGGTNIPARLTSVYSCHIGKVGNNYSHSSSSNIFAYWEPPHSPKSQFRIAPGPETGTTYKPWLVQVSANFGATESEHQSRNDSYFIGRMFRPHFYLSAGCPQRKKISGATFVRIREKSGLTPHPHPRLGPGRGGRDGCGPLPLCHMGLMFSAEQLSSRFYHPTISIRNPPRNVDPRSPPSPLGGKKKYHSYGVHAVSRNRFFNICRLYFICQERKKYHFLFSYRFHFGFHLLQDPYEVRLQASGWLDY